MGITSKLNSDISSFYKNSLKERQEIISKLANLTPDEKKILENLGYLSSIQIDSFIENVIGSFQLPIGIATNFRINDKDYLIPMVTEEPSVIAAASNAAKIAVICTSPAGLDDVGAAEVHMKPSGHAF